MKARVRSKRMLLLIPILICVFAFAAIATSLGNATITLQSHRCYKQWDLTRFVYRVVAATQTAGRHHGLCV